MATKTKGKANTSAVSPPTKPAKTYTNAMDKLRDEMASSKSDQIQLLGEGLTVMIQLHPEWEGNIMREGKTIDGALSAVRTNAKGGCSDPIQTTKSLCAYYGIPCDSPRALAMAVTTGMMGEEAIETAPQKPSPGGEGGPRSGSDEVSAARDIAQDVPAPDPFDLDALMGGAFT